ncbi:MAG: Hsp70 family protein [Mycolicibacterium hassiacum]|uniref:Hsp70 family protein n=1 Tax=Mycolicibacterium hassiacum TaxID=46351 RepID=UPI0023F73B50|nr:Hsp70 family protein [Mycolicibacterium hassiacum]MBX5487689.1 Hsp70 family protein [Mycolicibacterium hassiacum]
MADGVGLSIGTSRLTAVVVGRSALRRSPVLTRYPHRPAEVGVPGENPNLTEQGLVITDFVDRVGDPVGIVAADGSTHQADAVLADALRAMLYGLGNGRPPAGPVGVSHPAHWRRPAVDALRNALARVGEFAGPPPVSVQSDAVAALTALQDDPGLPGSGIVALCDFGGTGTNVTLADAGAGFTPLGPTQRHTDLCGDLLDQALLTHVIEGLAAAGTVDLSSTSAIGSLSRLRAECRAAKERLSTATVTTLTVEVPGHRSEVRLTRNELDDRLRGPLDDFAVVLQQEMERYGVRQFAAVATVGGGARIPLVTTTLSEKFRAPVITSAFPELSAAIGAGLIAARGPADVGATMAVPAAGIAAGGAGLAEAAGPGDATMKAPEVTPDETAQSSTFRALAWSEADDVPDVAPADSYAYAGPYEVGAPADVRPDIRFDRDDYDALPPPPTPWYRRPEVLVGAGALVVLAAVGATLLLLRGGGDATTPEPTPATTSAAPEQPAQAPAPEPEQRAPVTQAPRTVTQVVPPPQTRTATRQPAPAGPPPEQPLPPSEEAPPPATQEPPAEEPPSQTQTPTWTPPTWTPPTWTPPKPPYSTVPGLPWVPAPPGLPGQQSQP